MKHPLDPLSRPRGPHLGLLLSGGLDSAILLGWLLAEGLRVRPFYVRSGLVWEAAEQEAVERLLGAVRCPEIEGLIPFDLPLADLYDEHWSLSGKGTPGQLTADDAVYLPGRNPLLAIKAAVWCGLHGVAELALGVLGSNPFGDARPAFFAAFEQALEEALGARVSIVRPFAGLTKPEVMRLGHELGVPLELTFSCIAPVAGAHCGCCNKCAERKKAFREARIKDRTRYARASDSHLQCGRTARSPAAHPAAGRLVAADGGADAASPSQGHGGD